jgi:hypothetical protein
MKFSKIIALASLLGILIACNNDPLSDLTTEESQVFFTNHDESVNFSQFKTFSILDSVLVVGNQGTGSSLTDLDIKFLTSVAREMENLGYTYVSPNDNPDIGINVAQVRNAYLNVVSQPLSPFLGNYWGGGFGYGYGYPATFTYYQTRENYWYLEMLDFKNPDDQNKQFNVIWNAEIRGSGLFNAEYIDGVIQSVFKQSPYLKIN